MLLLTYVCVNIIVMATMNIDENNLGTTIRPINTLAIAISHAMQGYMIAPSDMMDGRVKRLRSQMIRRFVTSL